MEQTTEKSRLIKAGFVLLIILTAYYATKIITEIKSYSFIGGGATATNVVSFSGTGDVKAVPDLATISFTILENASTAAAAQTKVTTKETAVLAFLDKSGIAKKDIKTENYSSYPKYEYQNAICPQYAPVPVSVPNSVSGSGSVSSGSAIYCPPGKSVLTGYEVSENISVQVHDLTKSGDIIKGITDVGISNLNGPNFSIENQDKFQEQARKIAIDDAKAKAKVLASDLGVTLVRIVNFSENGNYAYPMYANSMAKLDSATGVAVPSPVLPTGENKITSNVTITYEIK